MYFVMLFKNKGSKDDYTKYRVLGLLNHVYKTMSTSTILLWRLMKECETFFLLSDRLVSERTGDAGTM